MIFEPTSIPGAETITLEPVHDERGFFARIWCRQEFERRGLAPGMVQASVSYTERAGALRGLHFAWPPSREGKLVRCVRGRVLDVVLDLRPDSPSFLRHHAVELDADERTALFVPPGVAHGFQTLRDGCELLYMMTDFYRPDLADGVRFDDECFGIDWPMPITDIHERDRGYPDFDRDRHLARFRAAEIGTRPDNRSG